MKNRIKTKINARMIGLSFIICHLSFSVALTSCTDWTDHYEPTVDGGGDATLWAQLKANPQLTDFCDVLEQTRIFRMHKKTEVSYAQLLNSGQAFTVIAPVNGTFDKQSYLDLVQTAEGDSIVEKTFVFNHLSRMTTSLKATSDTLHMLNGKLVVLTENTIQKVPVIDSNNRALNGVIHVIEHALPYERNIYERLCDDPDVSEIGANLRQYEWDEFDPDASVSSGIIEGVPVYIDSVVHEHNRMLDAIGYINSEDSTYWTVVPTNEGWREAWEKTAKFFVYDSSYKKADSLQRYWTNRALLDDAIFNMTDQKSEKAIEDSIVSVPYLNWYKNWVKGKPKYHVFYRPFDTGGVLDKTKTQSTECSNGKLYKTNKWPFDPEKTFFKEIWAEGEATWSILAEKDCRYTSWERVGTFSDQISESRFLQIIASSGTANWELTYRLDNVLSGEYDVCAIILPQMVLNKDNTKPCKFKAVINYVEADGKENTFNCNNTQFKSDPEKIDTVLLAEAFRFPATNYGQTTDKISITIKCSITARETSGHSREMLLDCIYLRPRTSKSE